MRLLWTLLMLLTFLFNRILWHILLVGRHYITTNTFHQSASSSIWFQFFGSYTATSNGSSHNEAPSPAVSSYQSNDLAPPSAPPSETPEVANQSRGKAKVLYDYFASDDTELSLIADEVLWMRLLMFSCNPNLVDQSNMEVKSVLITSILIFPKKGSTQHFGHQHNSRRRLCMKCHGSY